MSHPIASKRLKCVQCGVLSPWVPQPEPCECGSTTWRDWFDPAEAICDFCLNGDPEYKYAVDSDFVFLDIQIPGQGRYTHTSVGPWFACQRCADLVEARKWDRLARRAVRRFAARYGVDRNDPSFTLFERQYQKAFERVREHLTGKRRKLRRAKVESPTMATLMPDAAYSAALDAQGTLASFYRTDVGVGYARGFARAMTRRYPEDIPVSPFQKEPTPESLDWLTMLVRTITEQAETYFVASDMCDLIQVAAPQMPGQPLHGTDLPSKIGFVYLNRSLTVLDVHGRKIAFRAFGWHPSVDTTKSDSFGVALTFWSDWNDRNAEDDYVGLVDDAALSDTARRACRFTLCHIDRWRFGDDHVGYPVRQFIAGFWTLCQQPIVYRAHAQADRATRRRFARFSNEIKPITVVTLRRKKAVDPHGMEHEVDHQPANYSHRFIVSGHWRNQWLPSVGLHRQQWIAPFVKGPDEAPLIVKKRLYQLTR